MSNAVETVRLKDGVVTFDHATKTMRAVWDNGYTETWSHNGYDYEASLAGFRFFVSHDD